MSVASSLWGCRRHLWGGQPGGESQSWLHPEGPAQPQSLYCPVLGLSGSPGEKPERLGERRPSSGCRVVWGLVYFPTLGPQ